MCARTNRPVNEVLCVLEANSSECNAVFGENKNAGEWNQRLSPTESFGGTLCGGKMNRPVSGLMFVGKKDRPVSGILFVVKTDRTVGGMLCVGKTNRPVSGILCGGGETGR